MGKVLKEKYKKAIELWKEQNPDKKYLDIIGSTVIELEDGVSIPLGNKIKNLRQIYKAMQEGKHHKSCADLTEEEIEYLTNQGMIWDYGKWTEDNYRKAVKKWKKENPDKKYLDIHKDTKIELEGIGKVSIGTIIIRIRLIYKAMQEGKKYNNCRALTEEEIEYWTKEGMIWDYEKWTQDNYRKVIEKWKMENPDKKYLDIYRDTEIELDGVGQIHIGQYIFNRRHIYKAMQEGTHYNGCYDLTEEEIEYLTNQGMIWDYGKWTEDNYRKAVKKWKKENPDKKYLDIHRDTRIKLEGIGEISIGGRIKTLRGIYKAMQEGTHYRNCADLTEEEIEYWTSQGMIWDYEEYRKSKKDNSSIKKTTLEKYTEIFDGDEEKAERVVKCLTDLRERRKSRKKDDYNIDNILKEFDVDIETLEKYLSRTRSKEIIKRDSPLEYQGLTLREFCIKNGYNYDVVYRAIKLHAFCRNDTLEQLINRSIITYQRKGQKEPSTWVYEKYGNLVKHILLYLRLDASNILTDMSNYTISLEEAIRHNVFLQTKKTKEQDYLEEVYNYLIEEIDSSKTEEEMIEDIILKYQELAQEYRFTKEEHEVVVTSFERYIKTIKEYQKADVGLETNQTRKIEKIKDYGLEPEDIEESFFIPLEFDNKVLLGRKSELYLRRQLLRQYIIDWDFYTDGEKEVIKLKNQFTEEEIKMIESTRREINEVVEKIR